MSDEITRLETEIATLNATITTLAGLLDAQASLRTQLEARQRQLATLKVSTPSSAVGSQTAIHGDVSGSVISGTFSGPVSVGGTAVTHGPVISGPIQSGRDVNIATNQTIHNIDRSSGDRIQVGDITGSTGVAIGHGAQSSVRRIDTGGGDYAEGDIDARRGTFVSGDQFDMSGNFSGSILNIKSSLSQVSQSIGAASHGDQETKATLMELVAQLSAALQQAPMGFEADAEAMAETAKTVVEQATKAQPNPLLVQIGTESLRKAAASLATVLPVVVDIAGKIAAKIKLLLP